MIKLLLKLYYITAQIYYIWIWSIIFESEAYEFQNIWTIITHALFPQPFHARNKHSQRFFFEFFF